MPFNCLAHSSIDDEVVNQVLEVAEIMVIVSLVCIKPL